MTDPNYIPYTQVLLRSLDESYKKCRDRGWESRYREFCDAMKGLRIGIQGLEEMIKASQTRFAEEKDPFKKLEESVRQYERPLVREEGGEEAAIAFQKVKESLARHISARTQPKDTEFYK